MKHRYLTLSIAAGLFLQCAFTNQSFATPLSPVPVANLTVALSADAHPGTADRWVAEKLEHRVIWVDETELDDPSTHALAIRAIESGMAVLVTTRHDRPAEAVQRVDFLSATRRTMYRKDADGAFASASAPDDMSPTEAALFMADWLDKGQVFHDLSADDESPLLFDDAPAPRMSATPSRPSSYVPRKPVRKQTLPLPHGQSVTYDITIIRDITANSANDRKWVSVQTHMNLRPTENLALWVGTGEFRERKGSHFFIPKSYDIGLSIKAADGAPAIELSDFQPKNAKPTNQRIDTQVSLQTTSGSGLEGGLVEALIGAGTDPIAALSKLPALLIPDGSANHTETKTVSMNVDDYWVSASTPDPHKVSWTFELSPSSDNASNFEDGTHPSQGYKLYSVSSKLTPMMKSADLESGAIWSVPASWNGKLVITASSAIHNRVYFDPRLHGKPISSTLLKDHDTRQEVVIDLDSPLLTRTPTVRLRSMANGLCLSQPERTLPDVVVQDCSEGENGRDQQWHLDMQGTYRNRYSGQCLTAHPDGAIQAQPCKANMLRQEWRWAADRLASKLHGGDQWRLHLRDGKPHAANDSSRHSQVAWNEHSVLLQPWTGYPNKPGKHARVLGPNGLSTAIPDYYLDFKDVTIEERWEALPVSPSP